MSEQGEAVKTVEIVWGTYLENRKVDVKPIESSGKWRNLLVAGQDMKKEPFMFDKVKKGFQVPLQSAQKGGGVKEVLDNIERRMVKKYASKYTEGMTEREFFEEEIGVDMSPYATNGENFWRNNKQGRVILTKEGMTLDLNTPMGMLRYKILLANKNLIAPCYEDRGLRATYEFMIVNQGKLTSKKADEAMTKTKAYAEYGKVVDSVSSMKGFIRSLGRTVPANFSDEWLKTEIMDVLEASPSNFLSVVTDPLYKAKIFIQQAVEVGAIKRMNDRRYVLDNGVELGDLQHAVQFFKDPEHQETKMRIKSQIEMATNL